MSARATFLAAVVALGFVAGCGALVTTESARSPRMAPGGTWTDENGQPIALERFRGAPVVFSAFFTSCTVRCPMTVEKLRDVDRAFQRSGPPVPIVILTLDPQTDTPERLGRYKRDHHLPDHWHFLWGALPATRKLARYLSVNPAYDDGHIDHDVEIAIFDANGRLAHGFQGWAFDADAAVVR